MSELKYLSVIRAPRVSEKTARLQEVSNQYVFEVAKDATKSDVKSAVEKLFNVKVEAVNVANVKGKFKSLATSNTYWFETSWMRAVFSDTRGARITER